MNLMTGLERPFAKVSFMKAIMEKYPIDGAETSKLRGWGGNVSTNESNSSGLVAL
jgi:hypothetical protein